MARTKKTEDGAKSAANVFKAIDNKLKLPGGGCSESIGYMTGQMNCILHGLETPNTAFGDTLAQKIADFTDADRVDVIGANPPFGAGVDPTVKGKSTAKPINYYELDMGDVSLGKTRPLYETDLAEFEKLAKGGKAESAAHWTLDPTAVDRTTYDLSVHNPNKKEEKPPTVAECEAELKAAFAEIGKLMKEFA